MRYSTYSTYSKDPGGSGCSVGCLVRYSTYSTYSMDPGGSGGSARPTVRLWARRPHEPGKGVRQSGGQRAQLCVFGQG